MPHQNRVTPYGEIVVSPLRCEWMGNRGCLHEGTNIVRPWSGKGWITCALEFRGWVAPKCAKGRWTALFFYDEAVAFAAGHRPCAFVVSDDGPALLTDDGLRPWLVESGYVDSIERPTRGDATVITPMTNVAVLRAGYRLVEG